MALLPERPCSLRPMSWPSLEQSFWRSFLKGLAPAICVSLLIVFALATAPDVPQRLRGAIAPSVGFVVAIFLFTGLILLRKAHLWAGRAGPVQRLVTRARGRAYGFLAPLSACLASSSRYCLRSEALPRKPTFKVKSLGSPAKSGFDSDLN
jgi:hypothetical protein